jgi:hypothetical protein
MDIIEEARNGEVARKIIDHDNRLTTLEKALEKTGELVLEIHTALMGTMDKPGRIREIDDHSKFIEACKVRHEENKKERIDWTKWIERLTIAAMFTWILTKVGIK